MKWFRQVKEGSFSLLRVANERQIDRLLLLQLRIAAIIIVIAAAAEVGVFFLARDTGFLGTSALGYLRRYVLLPSGLNAALLLTAFCVRRWNGRLRVQAYVNCAMFVGFCFVIYSAHRQFGALSICFGLPIMMNIVFGDMLLTSFAYLACLTAKVAANLLIVRLPQYAAYRLIRPMDWVDFAISLVVLTGIYAISLMVIVFEREMHRSALNKELERRSLYAESITDPMTGAFNRKGLRRSFERLMAEDDGERCTMVMMDVDNFKQINDAFGHQMGDRYLKQLARLLMDVPNAEVYRFGGDEFCLLLRGYSREAAQTCCRDIQIRLRESEVCRCVNCATVSFGVAVHEKGMSPSELLRRADRALYSAKQGRNRSVFYEDIARP